MVNSTVQIVHVGALRGDVEFEQRNGFGIPDGLAGLDRFCRCGIRLWKNLVMNCDPDKGMSAYELAEALGKVPEIQKKKDSGFT